jgi:hypothetical protein
MEEEQNKNQVKVTKLISTALNLAYSQYPELHKKWVAISHKMENPNKLMSSIQQGGRLDLLLRAMEDEFKASMKENDGQPEEIDLSADFMNFLSKTWICHFYEIFRILKNGGKEDKIKDIHDRLKLLRMSFDKHEIAGEKRLLKEPLSLYIYPPKDNDIPVMYDKKDIKKTHRMPAAWNTEKGSLSWLVTDLKNKKSYWISRRELSDEILKLLQE